MSWGRINYRWVLDLPDHRTEFHRKRPWWEAARLADMRSRVVPGQTLVDVGSEEGDLTALYAKWGYRVSFIDPAASWITQTIQTLNRNGLDFDRSFCGFAGDQTRHGTPWQGPGFASLDERPDIPAMRLDSWPTADVYVVDTEGSEDRVLRGADLTAGATWYISIHGDVDPHAGTPSKIHALMREHDFRDQWLGYQHEWFYRFWK